MAPPTATAAGTRRRGAAGCAVAGIALMASAIWLR
jgi:hypothetical protein